MIISSAEASASPLSGGLAVAGIWVVSEVLAAAAEHSSSRMRSLLVLPWLVLVLVLL